MFAHYMAIELTCGKLLRSQTRKVVDLRTYKMALCRSTFYIYSSTL